MVPAGGGVPRWLGHNLLMQFSSLGCPSPLFDVAPVESVGTEAPVGIGPGLPSLPAIGGGEKGLASPPPDRGGPSSSGAKLASKLCEILTL